MSAHTIRETCSCGAEFVMAGSLGTLLDAAASRWRKGHQHKQPTAPVPSAPPDTASNFDASRYAGLPQANEAVRPDAKDEGLS